MQPLALVTGASRGIGRGIALGLARAGWSVVINYAGNQAAARDTARDCAALAPAAQFPVIQADITKAVEAGTIGGIRLIDHVAKWAYVPKGSPVKLPDGRSATVTIDLAGLDISLTLKRQGEPNEYPDDFYLAGSNLDLLSERLTCGRCKGLSPGETRLVTLATVRTALAEHRSAPPRFLVNIRSGLKIPLPPLDR